MDRLLRYLLGQFIRSGSITFSTATGARFICGDGSGWPVSARFLTSIPNFISAKPIWTARARH
jgi:cyclopropane-fatty-acyl-phospholipid synthase